MQVSRYGMPRLSRQIASWILFEAIVYLSQDHYLLKDKQDIISLADLLIKRIPHPRSMVFYGKKLNPLSRHFAPYGVFTNVCFHFFLENGLFM